MYIFLFVGMCVNAYLSFTTHKWSRPHSILGVITGLMGLVSLIVGITNFFNPSVGYAFGIVTLLWATLLMPSWMVWGAFQLAKKAAFEPQLNMQMDTINEFTVYETPTNANDHQQLPGDHKVINFSDSFE